MTDQNLHTAFGLIKRGEYDAAQTALKEGIKVAKLNGDESMQGLCYSALGLMFKKKGQLKESYRNYQQAEKLLPNDPEIKIITSVLLLEEFKQADIVERRMQKLLLEIEKNDTATQHHVQAILARALLLQGKNALAQNVFLEFVNTSLAEHKFVAGLDFKTVELFLKQGFCVDLCKQYLQKTFDIAKKSKETGYSQIIQKMLALI